MFDAIRAAARDRKRLAEIAAIATRFGLGSAAARLGLGGGDGAMPAPARVREALEALGPTFVKLGQILATRSDLLPPDWIAELERLHSAAPTLAFADLRDAVEAALGEPVAEAFATFDETPLAAASMAQVHRATTQEGEAIVLKIRRPGIRPLIESDLRLIEQAAALAERASAEVRHFQPRALVRQLAEAMLAELDFTNEALNAERIAADFADDPRVVVPAIHWRWTSETVLAMDFVAGTPPLDPAMLTAAGIDPRAVAETGADIVLAMVLLHGRFHADPHPGNLLCLPGNRIALLDLGMIGHVSARRRDEFAAFIQSLRSGDAALLGDVLAAWTAGQWLAQARIAAAAERLTIRHGGGRLVLSAITTDMMAMMREERAALPADLVLVFKAMMTLDGVLQRIAPDTDLAAAAERAAARLFRARYAPDAVRARFESLGLALMSVEDDLPRLVRAAARRLGEAPDQNGPVRLATAIERASLWLGVVIAGAAAVVALAVTLAR